MTKSDEKPKSSLFRGGMYTLDSKGVPVSCFDPIEWCKWIDKHPEEKFVKKSMVSGFLISTVFLGIDHNWDPDINSPILWETMVFQNGDTAEEIECERYCSKEEALAGHEKIARKYRNGLEKAIEFSKET